MNSVKKKKRIYFGTKKRTDLTEFEKSSINAYRERFSKWHNKQIDLLTFVVNFNFTLSIAIAGFIISNQDNSWFNCNNYSLVKTSLCLLATVATLGVLALISRLNDFRLTKNTIKIRRRIFELDNDIKYEDTKQSDKDSLIILRDRFICWATFLGKMTWIFFYLQLAVLLLIIWVILIKV